MKQNFKLITVRLTPEQYAQLRAEAQKQSRSMSAQFVHLLKQSIGDKK